MKKQMIFLLFLLIPFVSAANLEYTLEGKTALVEIEMSLEEIQEFEFDHDFEYSEGKIKYIEKHAIEKNGAEYFFVIKSEILPNSSIKVILPEGAFLNEDYFVFPKEYSLETNGQNIILKWENAGEKEILVPYHVKSKRYVWIFLILLIPLGIYFYLNWEKNSNKNYTSNLFREEKKIMEYLLKHKESWTKELVHELEIPKVRLSRKIRNLQEKGLIEKIPHGNENKIKLKKNLSRKKE